MKSIDDESGFSLETRLHKVIDELPLAADSIDKQIEATVQIVLQDIILLCVVSRLESLLKVSMLSNVLFLSFEFGFLFSRLFPPINITHFLVLSSSMIAFPVCLIGLLSSLLH